MHISITDIEAAYQSKSCKTYIPPYKKAWTNIVLLCNKELQTAVADVQTYMQWAQGTHAVEEPSILKLTNQRVYSLPLFKSDRLSIKIQNWW
jgi:hypothetical protein